MTITKEEVAQAVRDWCTAYDTRDVETIVAMNARAAGFGFRARDWRDHAASGEAADTRTLQQMYERAVDYHVTLEELRTAVEGDVGLSWGVFIEGYQWVGQPPEKARVRFSMALAKGQAGWQVLLFHRDIQPFDEDGRYPRALTEPHDGGDRDERS